MHTQQVAEADRQCPPSLHGMFPKSSDLMHPSQPVLLSYTDALEMQHRQGIGRGSCCYLSPIGEPARKTLPCSSDQGPVCRSFPTFLSRCEISERRPFTLA